MTDPTHNHPGIVDPIPPSHSSAQRGRQGAGIDDVVFDETHVWEKDAVEVPVTVDANMAYIDDLGYPVQEQHTLSYGGRVDMLPWTRLGPGLDGRSALVIGCTYDAAAHRTEVEVEVVPAPKSEVDESVAGWSKMVVDSYLAHRELEQMARASA